MDKENHQPIDKLIFNLLAISIVKTIEVVSLTIVEEAVAEIFEATNHNVKFVESQDTLLSNVTISTIKIFEDQMLFPPIQCLL